MIKNWSNFLNLDKINLKTLLKFILVKRNYITCAISYNQILEQINYKVKMMIKFIINYVPIFYKLIIDICIIMLILIVR